MRNEADIRGEFYRLEADVERQEVRLRRRRWDGWFFSAFGGFMVGVGVYLTAVKTTGFSIAGGVITAASGFVVFGLGQLMLKWNRETRAALAESRATIDFIRERDFFD